MATSSCLGRIFGTFLVGVVLLTLAGRRRKA